MKKKKNRFGDEESETESESTESEISDADWSGLPPRPLNFYDDFIERQKIEKEIQRHGLLKRVQERRLKKQAKVLNRSTRNSVIEGIMKRARSPERIAERKAREDEGREEETATVPRGRDMGLGADFGAEFRTKKETEEEREERMLQAATVRIRVRVKVRVRVAVKAKATAVEVTFANAVTLTLTLYCEARRLMEESDFAAGIESEGMRELRAVMIHFLKGES